MLGSRSSGVTRAAAVLAVAAVLGVTGCSGGDEEPEASETPSSGASATTSPSPSATEASPTATAQEQLAPDKPERPPAKPTATSREAFARYVMDTWAYALSTNQASALTSLSPKDQQCDGCKAFTSELEKRKKQGWFVDFPGVEVDKVKITSLSSQPGVWAAVAKVDIPASRSYFDDGSFRNDNEAHPNTDFTLTMQLRGPRYVLLFFRVG